MQHIDNTPDGAAAARQAKFGKLPERIPYEDMVTEKAATENRAQNTYNPEGAWNHFSCLALDLGL
ncbi:hypothetical protein CP973_21990 [Streptomyces albofaciens JCM 4342]|uniref:hypothetical protein n=1 Tax=Streptomyces albofaciens TaxID=66866 RepID=UPI00123A2D79|nr:hypothetical protein [Streptomyces albofaciens]KAA6212136.1 hypothetical protein CP973_21990 [Streptomyces albofaciens JCM 4342]